MVLKLQSDAVAMQGRLRSEASDSIKVGRFRVGHLALTLD